MILLCVYLLVGLVAHKFVWELLKRRSRGAGDFRPSPTPGRDGAPSMGHPTRVIAVKTVKVAILLGLVAQVIAQMFAMEVLPITDQPMIARWIGAALYTIGWLVAVLGRLQLGGNWSDIEAATVLDKQTVVTHGLYRYIRHPIYVGDLLLLAGFEIALNSWLVLGVAALAPVVLRQAVREESQLAKHLPGYRDYCRSTKRFIPFVV